MGLAFVDFDCLVQLSLVHVYLLSVGPFTHVDCTVLFVGFLDYSIHIIYKLIVTVFNIGVVYCRVLMIGLQMIQMYRLTSN